LTGLAAPLALAPDRPAGLQSLSGGGVADDPLSNLLRDLRIDGVGYGYARMAAPWGIDFPADGDARLHLVIEGEGWLQVEDQAPRRLDAGDAVFLPRGGRHAVRSCPDGGATCLDQMPLQCIGERVYRYDCRAEADVVLVSCSVRFNEPCLHPLLDLMPAALVVTEAQADTTVRPLLAAMADEVLRPRLGGATVLARLADVIITRLIRNWVEADGDGDEGWLKALRDPRIGKALAAIHGDPGRAWSISALARSAGLSRSLFVERFTGALAVPPLRYLSRLRMALAASLLSQGRLSIAAVAHRLGYRSVPAFSRAFKRHFGDPPGQLRRAARRP
jgi:AraC-like DNA-binding protein